MSEIVAVEPVPSPVPVGAQPMSAEDRAALRRAVAALERPSLAGRLSAMAGAPLDMIGRALPAPVMDAVGHATETAMRGALRAALATLPAKASGTTAGTESDPEAAALAPLGPDLSPSSSWRDRAIDLIGRFPPGDRGHKALAAVSGAIGGAFGLTTLAVELPLSTTLMLRSIAEIAQREGEDLGDPEAALACMQVFALGGRGPVQADAPAGTAAESGYFAVRGALAKAMSEAARYAAGRGLLDESAPALMRFAGQVGARFGGVVSQKLAAQAVPVLGALGGAAVNTAFMDHFQSIARGHFTVRRLERRYGKGVVREAYEAERASLGTA
ncbi:peptidase [Methylobacterium indicum]|uniref:EcsC family protein n=1 Tax=Methylobacterium indicum TaxID=1775910 RepID=UPI0007341255|nr:EcsC family protein [Methylobacterium indicum]KTS31420.1 peptidase [Methylobacterium indicum]KTS42058.1 peptidase [Methylobacterium indicum]KTS50069.1 peptidase [Methylobacterium indicum]